MRDFKHAAAACLSYHHHIWMCSESITQAYAHAHAHAHTHTHTHTNKHMHACRRSAHIVMQMCTCIHKDWHANVHFCMLGFVLILSCSVLMHTSNIHCDILYEHTRQLGGAELTCISCERICVIRLWWKWAFSLPPWHIFRCHFVF